MLQKIQFVAAIIHEPDLLILDEPFSGLDPVSMRLLRDQIVAEHRRGATILFSTHVMPQAEEICDHVVMIHRGRKVLDDPVSSILRPLRSRARSASSRSTPTRASRRCARCPTSRAALAVDGGYEMRLRDGVDAAGAIARVAARCPSARIELKRPRLEDVFVQIVADGSRSPDAELTLRAELAGASQVHGMSKILQIAAREFVATVFTKGFIIGLLVLPTMVAVGTLLGPRLFGADRNFAVAGQLAVVDATGEVAGELRAALTQGTPTAAITDLIRQGRAEAAGGGAVLEALGLAPKLTLVERPGDADLDRCEGVARAWRTKSRRISRSR